MSLLREIRDAAIDDNISLGPILRKSMVLAVTLGLDEFKEWVERELNGYLRVDQLPDYRVVLGEAKGDFIGLGGKERKDFPISTSDLPTTFHDSARQSYLMYPIVVIEELLSGANSSDICSPWPADLANMASSRLLPGMKCYAARLMVPKPSVRATVECVRNKLLSFVLEIETINPDAGEAEIGSEPVPKEELKRIYNMFFAESGNVVNIANDNAIQSVSVDIELGDLESLKAFLMSQGVESADVNDLESAIAEDGTPGEAGRFGPRVAAWLGSMTAKAAKGVWKLAAPVATAVATEALTKYYGLGK